MKIRTRKYEAKKRWKMGRRRNGGMKRWIERYMEG
jgi:hypothetical protein